MRGKDIFITALILLVFILGSCEKEKNNIDNCDECGSAFTRNLVVYDSVLSDLSKSNRYSFPKEDTTIDSVILGQDLFLNLYFEDSIIGLKSISQSIPFYLRFNSLYATPASISIFFADDQIDSIRFYLQYLESDSISNEILFNNQFDYFITNLASPQPSFSSIDSVIERSYELTDFRYGDFIRELTGKFKTNAIPKNSKIRFRTEVIVNAKKTLSDTSQTIFVK